MLPGSDRANLPAGHHLEETRRFRYVRSPLGRTVVQVIGGGAIVFAVSLWLGRPGAGG